MRMIMKSIERSNFAALHDVNQHWSIYTHVLQNENITACTNNTHTDTNTTYT